MHTIKAAQFAWPTLIIRLVKQAIHIIRGGFTQRCDFETRHHRFTEMFQTFQGSRFSHPKSIVLVVSRSTSCQHLDSATNLLMSGQTKHTYSVSVLLKERIILSDTSNDVIENSFRH